MTKRDDPAKYERERRAMNPERQRELNRKSYQKHREKRLAEKRAERDADPDKARAYHRAMYAKHREERIERARQYRQKRREEVNAKAVERYHANRDTIVARQRELRQRPEAKAKAVAAMAKWYQENPDRAIIHHAKRLLAEQVDCRIRDIPDDVAEAKAEQLKITRWVREQLANTPDRSGEADKTGTGLAEGESGLPEGSSKP